MPLHSSLKAMREAVTVGDANTNIKATPTTAAPEPWTMDAAMMWFVAAFYFAVITPAAVYFINRWRKRVFGPPTRGTSGREERAAFLGVNNSNEGDSGFLATIGAIIDRVMNRAALDGAAAWQLDRSSSRNNNRSSKHAGGARFKLGAGNALLRTIGPYLPGAQGRAAAARRNKEKEEATGEAVDVEVAGNGVFSAVDGISGTGVIGAGVRPDRSSASARFSSASSPAPGGVTGEGNVMPPGNIPSTMTARDAMH